MSSQEYYYVYRLWMPDSSPLRTSAGPWALGSWEYIGSRVSRDVCPEDDFGRRYYSSGDFAESFRAQPEAFAWEILSTHATKEEAWYEEGQQIHRIFGTPSCANRYDPSVSGGKFRPRYDAAWLRKNAEKNRKLAQDPEWQRKHAEANRKKAQDPEWRRKNAEAARKLAQDPEWQRKHAEANRKKAQDPEWLRKNAEKNAEKNRKLAQDPEWRRKNAEAARRRSQDPEWLRKNAESKRKLAQDPEWRRKVSEGTRRALAKKRLAKSAESSSEPSLF